MDIKQKLEGEKSELVNDLVATVTISEELWRYHPDNPKKVDIVDEYKKLEIIKDDITNELEEVEEKLRELIVVPDSTELDNQWANESE
jgi:hypothetical protein|tara:strand:+ start:1764 stop:2027 length:264 start_codon:yes stop_codon:yes gene_type:complete